MMNNNFENLKNSVITYLRGVRIEWGKITWPERYQVGVETLFVIVIVTVFTAFIYVVDVLFGALLSHI